MPVEKILHGDCLDELDKFPENHFNLVYADPPFFTQRKHKLTSRAESKEFSFDDVWAGHHDYAEYMHVRLQKIKTVLKDDGSIFVHCDKNSSHILRLVLDDVFGSNNFQSEIIWTYKRWSNSKKGLLPSHQTILFYSKSKSFKFNTVYTDYAASTNIDQILQRRTRDHQNKSVYEKDESGAQVIKGEKKGVPLSDVWNIPYLNPKAKERVGYPTQKPLLLMDQILALVTNEGDMVLDPFCGSGSMVVASSMMNRECYGIDVSLDAVELANNRLRNPIKTLSNLLKKGEKSYDSHDKRIHSFLGDLDFVPVQRNKGLDAILKKEFSSKKVYIKLQSESETISESCQLLLKATKNKGDSYRIVIQTKRDVETLLAIDLPLEVIVIRSPNIEISQVLSI